jgi:hypothetical protein
LATCPTALARRQWHPTNRHPALHLFILTALAVSVRLYVVVGDRPMFFAIRHAKAFDLLMLVAVLSLLIPGLLVALEWLAGRIGPRTRAAMHTAIVGLLWVAVAMPLVKPWGGLSDGAKADLGLAIGLLATILYQRFGPARMLLTVLGPLVVLSPAWFLLGSASSKFLFRWSDPQPLAVRAGRPTPVFVLLFDEFSGVSLLDAQRRIDPARYPNLAALAADSTWFRNASACYSETDEALPAVVTGNRLHPGINEPDAYEYPCNLFTLLANSHTLRVEEPVTTLCPEEWRGRTSRMTLGRRWSSLLGDMAVLELHALLPRAWTAGLPDMSSQWGFFLGSPPGDVSEGDPTVRRRETAESFIDAIEPGDRPQLAFMHVLLPHIPWTYLASGKEYPLLPLGPSEEGHRLVAHGNILGMDRQTLCWSSDPLAVAQARRRYLMQVGCVDRLVGRLVRRLKQTGLYDRSLIVVTADHGVAFVPNSPMRELHEATGPELMSIPLLIKSPGQHEAVVSDRNVESVDILPTIAASQGIELPWKSDGADAMDTSRPERPTKLIEAAPGDALRWTCDAKFDAKYAAMDRILREAAEPGPHAELLGRPLSACRTASESAGRAVVPGIAGLAAVDPAGTWLPVYVGGRVEPSPGRALPMDLAVAVNGTIRAVTRTFLLAGLENAWTAILPEECLRPGANDLRVFVVAAQADGPVLVPLEIAAK